MNVGEIACGSKLRDRIRAQSSANCATLDDWQLSHGYTHFLEAECLDAGNWDMWRINFLASRAASASQPNLHRSQKPTLSSPPPAKDLMVKQQEGELDEA